MQGGTDMLKKRPIVTYLGFVVAAGLIFFSLYNCQRAAEQRAKKTALLQKSSGKEVWITVFIHGSFGTLLGLLSLPRVIQDDVIDSLYHQITKKMRYDQVFYANQPIREKGLKRIYPSFDQGAAMNAKIGAYPIIKAYEMISQVLKPDEINFFYTFGWSGLVSQNRRRCESIRLYNSLAQEVERVRLQGFDPKIRLIAHSHGGNICLNLAAVSTILQTKNFLHSYKFSQNHDESESLDKMFAIVKKLPSRENAAVHLGQKRYDYLPFHKNLQIDELILLGTPIQVETEHFVLSPFFKRVYSLYSEKDVVQELDWVSTKQRISRQRFSDGILEQAKQRAAKNQYPHLTQAKIIYERALSIPNPKKAGAPVSDDEMNPIKSLWYRILKSKPAQKDPDHKELWFFSWANEDSKNKSFVTPLPTAILVPFVTSALNLCPTLHDLDLNLTCSNDKIVGLMHKHGHKYHEASVAMPLAPLIVIKEQVRQWNPGLSSETVELNKTYHYLSENTATPTTLAQIKNPPL